MDEVKLWAAAVQALGVLPASLPVTGSLGCGPRRGRGDGLPPFVVVSSARGPEGGTRRGGAARSPGLVARGAPGRAGRGRAERAST